MQAPNDLLRERENRHVNDKIDYGGREVDDLNIQASPRNCLVPIPLVWGASYVGKDNGSNIEDHVDRDHGLTSPVKGVAIR